MTNVTQILRRIERGDAGAAPELFPLVYEELHRVAARRMALEKPGQTLQATALVHEAFLRLVDSDQQPHWDSQWHFFAAAAEAMRRILVENARRKRRVKHGGELTRVEMNEVPAIVPDTYEDLIALDEALDRLKVSNAQASELVQLRYFAGLSSDDAAKMLGISTRTADRLWAFARAWLRREISTSDGSSGKK